MSVGQTPKWPPKMKSKSKLFLQEELLECKRNVTSNIFCRVGNCATCMQDSLSTRMEALSGKLLSLCNNDEEIKLARGTECLQ